MIRILDPPLRLLYFFYSLLLCLHDIICSYLSCFLVKLEKNADNYTR